MKKNIIKIVAILIAVIIIMLVVHIVRNMMIFSNLNNKLHANLNVKNCYVEADSQSGDVHVNLKTYIKNDDSFIKLVRNSKEGNQVILTEINKSNVSKSYVETSEEKYFIDNESTVYIPAGIYVNDESKNNYYEDTGELFKYALSSKISSTEINGKKCYEINGNFCNLIGENNNEIHSVYYIEKDSGLCIRTVDEWEDGENKNSTTCDYKYTFNDVKDDDIKFLDDSEYVDRTQEFANIDAETESLLDEASEDDVQIDGEIESEIETKKDL